MRQPFAPVRVQAEGPKVAWTDSAYVPFTHVRDEAEGPKAVCPEFASGDLLLSRPINPARSRLRDPRCHTDRRGDLLLIARCTDKGPKVVVLICVIVLSLYFLILVCFSYVAGFLCQ